MNQNIENLESKLAHLELAHDKLDQVVYEQAKKLDAALNLIKTLQSQLKSVIEEGGERQYTSEEERPPHY